MKIFFKTLIFIVFFIGAQGTFAFSEIPILVYHSIGPAKSQKETASQLHFRITPENFEKQMKYLQDNGYHPITLATYADSLKNYVMKLPEKAIILTFDDGLKNQYQYAVPILEKYKFPATFFIVSDYVNSKYGGYMSWENLKDLIKNNFEIGSHTKTHPILTKLDSQKLAGELEGSKKMFENKLGIKIKTLAYPNYLQNETVRGVVKSAGYVGARAGWAKFKNSKDHIYELKSQEALNNPNPFSEVRLSDLP